MCSLVYRHYLCDTPLHFNLKLETSANFRHKCLGLSWYMYCVFIFFPQKPANILVMGEGPERGRVKIGMFISLISPSVAFKTECSKGLVTQINSTVNAFWITDENLMKWRGKIY